MIDKCAIGQIVFSKYGRDKGKPFIILALEDEFIYLADGKLRLVDKPKLKKIKHVQLTNINIEEIKHKIIQQEGITNSEIRNAINEYFNVTS